MKKGFTLIELLAVLAVLAIAAVIAVPTIGNSIQKSKQKAYEQQIYQIKNVTKTYIANNPTELDDGACINVQTLKKAGLLSGNSIIDPRTNEEINGSVIITYENNKYKYEYQENTCS